MGAHWEGNPYRRPNSPFWHIVFEDEAGVVRRRSTKTKDLRIARDVLAAQLREVEQLRTGHVDKFAETRKRPINDLVVEFKALLEAEKRAPRYVKGTIRQLREFIAFAKVATVPGLHVTDAERFLETISRKRSAKTRDNYAGSLRSFGNWLRRTGRWECDPLQGVRTRTATKDRHRVFKRMSLRFAEAERLVEAAWARFEAEKVHAGWPSHAANASGDAVRDRQALYWFVLTTGFRANECASIRWEDLTLDGAKLSVRLSGKFTKNGDDALVPLQSFVADALKDVRRRRTAVQVRSGAQPVVETDLVFAVPSHIARLVRKDGAFAGLIPQRSPTSRRLDFHALRKSCARILIELGLHPKLIQQTLRHGDIRLTMDLYGELGEDDLFRELPGKFPVPKMFTPKGDDPAGEPRLTVVTA
jgi:integrase